MALVKSVMSSGFELIFNPESSPSSESECASLMTDVIMAYLGAIQIAPPAAPGVGPLPPAPNPGPDPSFVPGPGIPITPVITNRSIIQDGLEGAMTQNKDSASKVGWTIADLAFASYVTSTFSAWSEPSGYTFAGACVPGAINFFSIMSSESDDFADICNKLADHIHTFFTTSVYTGTYTKVLPPPATIGPFVGAVPHVTPLM